MPKLYEAEIAEIGHRGPPEMASIAAKVGATKLARRANIILSQMAEKQVKIRSIPCLKPVSFPWPPHSTTASTLGLFVRN